MPKVPAESKIIIGLVAAACVAGVGNIINNLNENRKQNLVLTNLKKQDKK